MQYGSGLLHWSPRMLRSKCGKSSSSTTLNQLKLSLLFSITVIKGENQKQARTGNAIKYIGRRHARAFANNNLTTFIQETWAR